MGRHREYGQPHGGAWRGGTIQITEATHALIHQDFLCEPHGTIQVNGKGEMKVWYVLDNKEQAK